MEEGVQRPGLTRRQWQEVRQQEVGARKMGRGADWETRGRKRVHACACVRGAFCVFGDGSLDRDYKSGYFSHSIGSISMCYKNEDKYWNRKLSGWGQGIRQVVWKSFTLKTDPTLTIK